jgi:hypothetical protein
MKVGFAQIDAKGDHYAGYSPVGFYDEKEDENCSELTQEEERLLILLKREYLTRLNTLQEELAATYEKTLSELTSRTPADKDSYGHALNEKDYKACQKHAESIFPGRQANYYT